MIFDIENWLWKSEFCNLHGQIHNQALICQRPFTVRKCWFPFNQPKVWCKSCWKILKLYLLCNAPILLLFLYIVQHENLTKHSVYVPNVFKQNHNYFSSSRKPLKIIVNIHSLKVFCFKKKHLPFVKFGYSEKATKFEKIFPLKFDVAE